MRTGPRTFGDGGGVSRRDHAVRVANSANAGEGGLRAIDSVLEDVSRSRIGKVDHLGNLFRTMDMQPDSVMDTRKDRAEGLAKAVAADPYPEGTAPLGINRPGSDPYSVVNDPNYYDQDTRWSSAGAPEVAMAGRDKSNVGFEAGGLGLQPGGWSHNNLDAAAYHLEVVGTPIRTTNNWFDDDSAPRITKVTKVDSGGIDPEHVDYDVETTSGTIRAFPKIRNPHQTWG